MVKKIGTFFYSYLAFIFLVCLVMATLTFGNVFYVLDKVFRTNFFINNLIKTFHLVSKI